jgi:hypothetical protein
MVPAEYYISSSPEAAPGYAIHALLPLSLSLSFRLCLPVKPIIFCYTEALAPFFDLTPAPFKS